ncbi:hypothetical protein [Xylanimonas sp. McL0601]|uniref:hypothetical protein n=1 Tax=Xylanimonas sp. McL0601 TaxID=3414739 RepID=UPI003CEF9859
MDGARRLGVALPDGLDGVIREADVLEARSAARGEGSAYCHNDFERAGGASARGPSGPRAHSPSIALATTK